jgi:predicted amidohydrolase YtcJ
MNPAHNGKDGKNKASPFTFGAICACCAGSNPFAADSPQSEHHELMGELLAAAAAASTQAPAPKAATAAGAVTVFTAATVNTMDPATEGATAVAVADGRILAVGSLEEVERALAGRPFTIDPSFADKVLMPGLIEQHLHPILGALTLSMEIIAIEDWELPGRTAKAALTEEAYQARLREAEAALTDPSAYLFSWGYHKLWHGPLNRAVLDRISPTRPILVWHRSCHEMFLNSAAIADMGIDAAMVSGKGPRSDQVDLDAGHFYEKGLELITGPVLKRLATPERVIAGLNMLVAYLHHNGVTTLNEPGALITPQLLDIYRNILGAEDTPFYSLFIPDGRAIFDRHREAGALAVTKQVAAMAPAGKVRFLPGQVKLYADGAIVSQLMQMKDGYLDGHQGEWILPPPDLQSAVRLYWDAGYQIHTHVNGDLGLEVLLTALEERAQANPRADHRCVIVHFANSTEAQVGRIAKLGAIVSANPYYVRGFADMYAATGLGPERADNMVRAGSVVRRGVPFSLHSDLPMGPAKPLFNAWCAVNRVTTSGRVAGPDQRISVEQALRAITIDAAQSWRLEHEMGSITPGKVANFTILLEDPRKADPIRLKDIPIWGTVFEGRPYPIAN